MDQRMHDSEQISLFCRLNGRMKRQLSVRSSEMGMLIYLVKTNGEKTPNAVANFFQVTKAMATNMATSLCRCGYIEKRQSETDKRSYCLIPTEKAIQLVENTYEDYLNMMHILETKMGLKEFRLFIQLIEQANQILLEERNHG